VAQLEAKSTIKARIVLALDEEEARALEAIFGYNDDEFLKVFYERMGRNYLEPHEEGFRTLSKSLKTILGQELKKADNAREAFSPRPKR